MHFAIAVARSCIRTVGAIVTKQCFRTYNFPRRFMRVADQKIETDPAVTEHNQYLASHETLPDGRPRASNLEGST
jgi:hypothetical protein